MRTAAVSLPASSLRRPVHQEEKIETVTHMTNWRLALIVCLGLAALVCELHAQADPDAIAITPSEMRWLTQDGEKFDAAALKALPAGSFYTEPADVAHFVEVLEPVVIQVRGTGPSGRAFLSPGDNP
jgi:hypothetical protein